MKNRILLFSLLLCGLVVLEGCANHSVNAQNSSLSEEQSETESQTNNPQSSTAESSASLNTETSLGSTAEGGRPQQTKTFSESDLNKFQSIKKYYPDFEYSDTYKESEDHKKMIFDKKETVYDVICYEYDGDIINYFNSADTSDRKCGFYSVVNDTVIKIEKAVGTNPSSIKLYKNGVKMKEYDFKISSSNPIEHSLSDNRQKAAFSKEELNQLKLVKKYSNDFAYSNDYYSDGYGKEMIFDQNKNPGIPDMSYDVTYYDEGMINYGFDEDIGHRGCGATMVLDTAVINIENGCGQTAYGYTISKNGKEIDKKYWDISIGID